MFKKILIANRGEIAVRVENACRELGVAAAAIFSEPDKDARHVMQADEAWQLDGPPARVYLDTPQIIELAKRSAAEAIHPGYGFLAENADFAQACLDAGITFIGPAPDVIRKMGSKVQSRRMMEAAGVPVVPGTLDPVSEVYAVKELGTKYGYPLAIKASAGGGGRGLRVVRRPEDVEQALSGAQREGSSYFGDSMVYVEKYLDKPRHIEVQILADRHGHVVHLGERDCSSQRRHQKLLEESPASNLDPKVRASLLEAAVRGAASIGYTSAGTVECLVAGDHFYFLEMNTRVQVEHPVTEFITGIDIVKEQILVAAGEPLSFSQTDVAFRGYSIECRINAEDPSKNFLPSPGTITRYREPQMPWVRVDSACDSGYQVLPFYDSLLAKLVVWGRTRDEAIVRMRLALEAFEIEGVSTTIPLHLLLLSDPAYLAGQVYTTYVESEMKERYLSLGKTETPGAATPYASQAKPELTRATTRKFEINLNQRHFNVAVTELVSPSELSEKARPVGRNGASATAARPPATRSSAGATAGKPNHSGEIRAAMHGIVKQVLVKEGDTVSVGQKLLIVEAMKMESEILADRAARVVSLKVQPGETVEASGLLLVLGD